MSSRESGFRPPLIRLHTAILPEGNFCLLPDPGPTSSTFPLTCSPAPTRWMPMTGFRIATSRVWRTYDNGNREASSGVPLYYHTSTPAGEEHFSLHLSKPCL